MASCEFTVKRQPIVPSFIQISDELYAISNLTHLHASCTPEQSQARVFSAPTRHDCSPCIIRVPCGCSLLADELEIVRDEFECENKSSTLDVGHAVNMAVLQSFYDMANETVLGSSLFEPHELREPEPLKLSFFGDTIKLLAADERASYSLQKLADSLRNDTVIINTPAEAVLRQMLNSAIDNTGFPGWFNLYTYATLLPLPCIVALSVWLYLVNRKLRTVTMVSGLSAYARVAKGFALPTTPLSVTTTSEPWLWELQSIRSLDGFIFASDFIIILHIIILYIALYRLYRRRSFVYLELRADGDRMTHIRWYTFDNASRNFSLRAPKASVILTSYRLFGILSFTSKAWRITNSMTRKVTILPTSVFVPFWRMAMIKAVIDAPNCSVHPLLVYSHEYDYRAVEIDQSPPDCSHCENGLSALPPDQPPPQTALTRWGRSYDLTQSV